MKNIGKKVVAIAISSMMIVQPIYAGTLFNVSSTETKEVMPDTAYVTAYISCEDVSIQQSMNDINRSVDKLAQNLNKLDIGIAHEDIVLQNIYSYESNTYNPTTGEVTAKTYVTNATISIKVKDIKNASGVYDVVLKTTGLSNVSLSYELEDRESFYNELLASASNKAINKATVLAKSVYGDNANVKVTSISENNANTTPIMYGKSADMADTAINSTQMPQITISATAYVTIDAE